jgi:archaellum component FlaC
MGQSKRQEELRKDINIIKFALISKKIIPSDKEYIKLLEEELDELKRNFEKITNDLNEMRKLI